VTALRMTLRVHRFEAVAVALGAAVTIGFALVVCLRLLGLGVAFACFTHGPQTADCGATQFQIEDYLSFAGAWGYYAIGAIALLPLAAGLILGVALVGKEIDRGTTAFAWSINPSRRRWLAARVLPIAILLTAATLAAGELADWLEFLRDPGTDPMTTFNHMGTRGPVVAAEGLAFFGLALALGARFGRVLPAFLIAAVVSGATFVGVWMLNDAWLHNETVLVPGQDGGVPGRSLEYLLVAPDGTIMDWQQAYQRYGENVDLAALQFGSMLRVNPPELYPISVARMSILFSAIGLASITLAFAVIERRRP